LGKLASALARHATLPASVAASLALHAAVLWIAADLEIGGSAGNNWSNAGDRTSIQISATLVRNAAAVEARHPLETATETPPGDGPAEQGGPAPPPHTPPPVSAAPRDLPGPAYHAPEALTVRPRPLAPIEPAYPVRTREISRGRIVLLLMINSGGSVDRVLVEESDLGARFEDAAVSAFAAARFSPGQIDGTPVGSKMRVEVTFESDFAGQ
jgi:TonB family protein